MNTAIAEKKVIRRNIEIYPETAKRLERLRMRLEARNDTEVVRRALRVLDEMIQDEDKGHQHYVKEDGELVALRIV